MKLCSLLLLLCALLSVPNAVAIPDAADKTKRWTAAKFADADVPFPAFGPSLESHLHKGVVLRDRIEGHSLLIVGEQFHTGVAMRSPGEIVVRIPAGARSFRAMLGVDSNDLGYYANTGRGSVVASIESDGRILYKSPLLREGMNAIPVRLELNGQHEFSLRLGAVGERPPTYQAEWDQVDWADASVSSADGSKLLLSDLPDQPSREAYSHTPPFSFEYGDKTSTDILKNWKIDRQSHPLDDARTQYIVTYEDPSTRLIVRCVAIAYRDFPVVEWTVYFKNGGTDRTPILQNIQALDTKLEGNAQTGAILHHSRGSFASEADYQPLESEMKVGSRERFSSIGGRGTDGDMPYFNLSSLTHGVIFVLGWPGQWSLVAERDATGQTHVKGGQELTHFWLAPGEEVRTPLAVVQFYDGDWIDGQNLWRRWMLAHNLPRPGGQLPAPFIAGGSSRYTVEMQFATEANQKGFIDQTLNDGIPIDHWWMDAGWYPLTVGWWKTGTWVPDPKRFPQGLKPVMQYAHARHMKVVLWFEPERVSEDSWLFQNHPDWLIGAKGKDQLLFLGNPDAWHWLVEHVSQMIGDDGIDVYRQDFNFPPLSIWHSHDSPDREGITEIEHIQGYLSYFDELRRRFPNLLIDTCASGGRRNDLETLRRAVPLWRSDYPYKPISQQAQTYGLSLWVPYYGTAVNSLDPYTFRSQMTPALGFSMDHEQISGKREMAEQLLGQWREIAQLYFGDFIPLTPYSVSSDSWMAWQWNRPEGDRGVVEVFRRETSPFTTAQFKLRGLDPGARYIFTNLDSAESTEFSGKVLMESGLLVALKTQPASCLLTYKKVASGGVRKAAQPLPGR